MQGKTWSDWRKHGRLGEYTGNSPNLMALRVYLEHRGWKFLGCRVVRPVRGGSSPSIHSWGAAMDMGHPDPAERRHIIDFVIEHSEELGIGELHDYAAARDGADGWGGYWKADRGWKACSPTTSDPAMQIPGKRGGGSWLHFETTIEKWHDSTPVDDRITAAAQPAFTPSLTAHGNLWDRVGDVPADQRPYLGHPNCQGFDDEVAGIKVSEYAQFAREVMQTKGGIATACDGAWQLVDMAAVHTVQGFFGTKNDEPGVIGPNTWGTLDFLAGI